MGIAIVDGDIHVSHIKDGKPGPSGAFLPDNKDSLEMFLSFIQGQKMATADTETLEQVNKILEAQGLEKIQPEICEIIDPKKHLPADAGDQQQASGGCPFSKMKNDGG